MTWKIGGSGKVKERRREEMEVDHFDNFSKMVGGMRDQERTTLVRDREEGTWEISGT